MSVHQSSFLQQLIRRVANGPLWLWTLPILSLVLFLFTASWLETWAQRHLIKAGPVAVSMFRLEFDAGEAVCAQVTYPRMLFVETAENEYPLLSVQFLFSDGEHSASADAEQSNSVDPISPLSSTNIIPANIYAPTDPLVPVDAKTDCSALTPAQVAALPPQLKLQDVTTYTVTLNGGAFVGFRSKEGIPQSPRFVLKSSSVAQETPYVLLYLMDPLPRMKTIPLNVSIELASDSVTWETVPVTLSLRVDTFEASIARRIAQGALNYAFAVWLALLPLFAGLFAWIDRELQSAKRREIENIRARLDHLDNLLPQGVAKYAQETEEIEASIRSMTDKKYGITDALGVSDYFDRYAQGNDFRFARALATLFVAEERATANGIAISLALEEVGASKEDIQDAIEWAIGDSDLSKADRLHAVALLESMKDLQGYEFSREYLEQMHWVSILHSWPSVSFWRRNRTDIRANKFRIARNAFLSLSAESDPYLFPPGKSEPGIYTSQPPKVRPGWYKTMRRQQSDSHPTYVMGPKGAGRTAAALILAWQELLARDGTSNAARSEVTPASVLPVYWRCNYFDRNSDLLGQYAVAYARTLLGYIAATPYEYFQAEDRSQSAMAMLLSLGNEPGEDLRVQFAQHRVRRSPMPPRFFEILSSQMGKMRYNRRTLDRMDPDRLLQILFDARPNSVIKILPIVDVHLAGGGIDSDYLHESLQVALGQLLKVNMSGTVFVPGTADDHKDFSVTPEFVTWEDYEIRQLLEDRLYESTEDRRDDLGVFCDPREVDSLDSIKDRVIEASHMLPSRLIEIMQQFVRQIESTGVLLNQEEVDKILARFENPSA